MKKVGILAGLAVIAIALVLSWPQLGTGQFFGGSASEDDTAQLQQEIQMLQLINELQLSVEQMTAIKDELQLIRTSRDALKLPRVELRDFLVGFKGTRDEYHEALKPFQEKVAQAEEALGQQLQASVEAIKDLLSYRQGEILEQHFAMAMMHPMMMEHQMMTTPAIPMQNMEVSPPAAPQGDFHIRVHSTPKYQQDVIKKFETKMERFGEEMEAWGEQLGDEIESWLDSWESDEDWDDSDGIRIYSSGDGNAYLLATPPAIQYFEMPELRAGVGRRVMMLRDMFTQFLLNHLDVLDKAITDKLINMEAVPQSTEQTSI